MFSWLVRRLVQSWGGGTSAPVPTSVITMKVGFSYIQTTDIQLCAVQSQPLQIAYVQSNTLEFSQR